ncbi:hypothetical protein DFH09DRAFT_1108162 [Mycena vulgaris]|nr:hypothetical protein DFH09DRAFT_1108162 [Mycena vulgaris]
MSGLPDVLKIPDGLEKLSIPAGNLPVSALIKLKLPPQRASSIRGSQSRQLWKDSGGIVDTIMDLFKGHNRVELWHNPSIITVNSDRPEKLGIMIRGLCGQA